MTRDPRACGVARIFQREGFTTTPPQHSDVKIVAYRTLTSQIQHSFKFAVVTSLVIVMPMQRNMIIWKCKKKKA